MSESAAAASDVGAYPRAGGLQFTPTRQNAGQRTAQNHHGPQPPIPAATPQAGESQEIMAGSAGGRAIILLGDDEIDLESEGRRENDRPSSSRSKRGPCPTWLCGSSSKTKGLLGLSAMLFLGFVAVLVVGVLRLPSPDGDGGGAAGGGTVQSNAAMENAATGDPAVAPAPPMPAAPEPSPVPIASTMTAVTDPPTRENVTVPVSKEEVEVVLPESLERKVPDFSRGLNDTERRNWDLVEGALESEISALFSSVLPGDGYSLGSVLVDSFDGYSTGSIRRRKRKEEGGARRRTDRRGLRQEGSTTTTHAVVYSSSVTVNCIRSDCGRAPGTVAGAASELSELEFLRISYFEEEEEERVPAVIVVEAGAAAAVEAEAPEEAALVVAADPTKSPVVQEVVRPLTPAPVTPTDVPTESPATLGPSPGPVTPIPTEETVVEDIVDVPAGPIQLSDQNGDCSRYTPCEMCYGSCDDDDECEDGLLCFKRRGYAYVPGCVMPGRPNRNYCYDPFAEGLDGDVLLPEEDRYCDKKDRCGKCMGDCDEDDDCEKDLFCYRRSEFELVPGCAGQGKSGTDYCFDPADLDGLANF